MKIPMANIVLGKEELNNRQERNKMKKVFWILFVSMIVALLFMTGCDEGSPVASSPMISGNATRESNVVSSYALAGYSDVKFMYFESYGFDESKIVKKINDVLADKHIEVLKINTIYKMSEIYAVEIYYRDK